MKTTIYFNLLHHNLLNFIKSSKCYRFISINHQQAFLFITKLVKNNSVTRNVSCCSKQDHYMTCKKNTDQLKYMKKFYRIFTSVYLSRLACLIQEYLFSIKKIFRNNTKNSAEIGIFVTSLI